MDNRYTYATTLAWGGDIQTGEAEVECSFSVSPGYPATGPSYASGGDPGEPAMVEDITITSVDGKPWGPDAGWHWMGLSFADATDTLINKLIMDCECDMLEAAADEDCAARDEWDDMRREERW